MKKIVYIIFTFLLILSISVACQNRHKEQVSAIVQNVTNSDTVSHIITTVLGNDEDTNDIYVVIRKQTDKNPFYLLKQAYKKTKSQLLVTFELMLILLVILSFVLYLAEHFAQPAVYKHFPTSMLWTFVKCIQDPGEMAPPKPITVLGRIVANVIGLVGVAIFAIPAGIVSSGFIGAMEEEQQSIQIQQNIEKLHLAFERKLDRPTGFQIAPKYVSVTEIQARLGLKEDEILDAVRHDDHYRLVNIGVTQTADEHPQDKLAVEHYLLNTVYGQCINRGNKVTIFSPSDIVDPIIGWWSYYLAKIGGFNYVSRELGQTRPYLSYYTYRPELEIPGNVEFMADMNKLANSEDCWVFSVMPASGNQEPKYPTQFHFTYGAKKGDESYNDPNITLNDVALFEAFYRDFENVLETNYQLKADRQRYHNNSNANYFARHLDHKVNAVALRVAWSVTCWDMRAIKLAQELSQSINQYINHADNPDVPDLKVKDIGYEGYTN